jgi:hypothetical protein
MEQIAAAVAGLFCGWRVIYTSFLGSDQDRAGAVRWWKLFYGPLGGWVCIWGTIAMITSAPFDDWWHAAYGLDVKILTPPHVFLLLGMVTVQLGAMLMMLAEQNRSGDVGRRGLLFSTSMGLVVLMFATVVYEDTGVANMRHAPKFFQICAAIFPVFLMAVARAGKSRWPATTAAATYMVTLLVLDWVLVQVPATPKLAPIYNPVTHLTPPGFPIWLIPPALAIDWLVARFGRRDWLLSALVGPLFVLLLLGVEWPFSSFLLSLKQPNPFFGIGYWDYGSKLGPWTTQFFNVPGRHWARHEGLTGAVDLGAMVKALVIAAGFGIAASRLGLWWGGWMQRVRR